MESRVRRDVFQAIADPTRRAILSLIALQAMTPNALAEHFDTLFTTEASIDVLKQTVLQLAVMGKLVPQDPNDEPASALLKRIAHERARLEAKGACKKIKPLPCIEERAQPFQVPNGWEWIRWVEIAQKIGDIDHKMPDTVKDGVPYVSFTQTIESILKEQRKSRVMIS